MRSIVLLCLIAVAMAATSAPTPGLTADQTTKLVLDFDSNPPTKDTFSAWVDTEAKKWGLEAPPVKERVALWADMQRIADEKFGGEVGSAAFQSAIDEANQPDTGNEAAQPTTAKRLEEATAPPPPPTAKQMGLLVKAFRQNPPTEGTWSKWLGDAAAKVGVVAPPEGARLQMWADLERIANAKSNGEITWKTFKAAMDEGAEPHPENQAAQPTTGKRLADAPAKPPLTPANIDDLVKEFNENTPTEGTWAQWVANVVKKLNVPAPPEGQVQALWGDLQRVAKEQTNGKMTGATFRIVLNEANQPPAGEATGAGPAKRTMRKRLYSDF